VDISAFFRAGGLFTGHINRQNRGQSWRANYVVGGFSEVGPLLSVPGFRRRGWAAL